MHDDRGPAEQAVDRRFRAVNLSDVVERQLGDRAAGDAEESKVGQQVALAGKAASELPWPAAPEQPFPWQQDVGRHGTYCFPKLTFGTVFASGGAWKKGYSLKPNIFAVMFEGNWPRFVLYAWIASL